MFLSRIEEQERKEENEKSDKLTNDLMNPPPPHLLLHPVEQLSPLLPEPVHGDPGVDVPLPGHLQPGQVGVLLTDGATEGLLSSRIEESQTRDTEGR